MSWHALLSDPSSSDTQCEQLIRTEADAVLAALNTRFAAPEWRGVRTLVLTARGSTRVTLTAAPLGERCVVTNATLASAFAFDFRGQYLDTITLHPQFVGVAHAVMLVSFPATAIAVARASPQPAILAGHLKNALGFLSLLHPAPYNSHPFALERDHPPPPYLTRH